ncbi:uncharacterized protein LOC133840012 [Drosophila sulfurigaster albostrigata]|uniref:uncharacterized protein LOC133840012 n=1 Tax=Drosophila sulfurigaster albostrigata TaxID=89887 RepID=UPI002D21C98D|nr:uncharacterized protein LOC133840012 [Drosophila sulfurigaster albostrigata]
MWTLVCSVLYLALVVHAELDVCLEELGCLKGTTMPGYKGAAFEAFMGIPFAQPPIGEMRFKNPVAATAWQGTLDASKPHNSCLQKCYFILGRPIFGEEDCLYLNVYRPVVPPDHQPLPVMFYIHSGGFYCGSSDPLSVGPEYLMDTQQVILVTINYRLGAFGFLGTGDSHMSGNFGLKDQRLALQWVQQNIASFGGDPKLVTIFGHSAGGMSAHYHMLSPNSKGLFHRAMSLSGTALTNILHVKDPLNQVRKLAESAGVAQAGSLNSKELVESLRGVDAMDLLLAGDAMKVWDNVPLIDYGIVIEQDATPESFFNEALSVSHLAGRIHEVPWLLGSSSRAGEGSMFLLNMLTTPELLKVFNSRFLELMSVALYLPDETTEETLLALLKLYDVEQLELNEQTMIPLSNLFGDFTFLYPLYASAESYVKYAKESLSIYRFEFHSLSNISFSRAYSKEIIPRELGPVHMDDALHTIRMPGLLPNYPEDSADELAINRLTMLLVEFAKTGVFYNSTDLPPCKAEDFTADKICNYLRFGDQNGVYRESIESSMDLRGLSLWKKLYTKPSVMIHTGNALLLPLSLSMLMSLMMLPMLLTLVSASNLASNEKSLVVCGTNLGCLMGVHMPGYQSKRFEAFLGIPYALPPIGELRFSNPKVMPKLQGIYNATSAKADCIQKNYLMPTPLIYGEEDCLYLNVYRPENRLQQNLPVMVYIHGGGFFSGSAGPAITGPEYFMDTEEVILVTMAYRLGALGFLSTEDAIIPGNFGLKDQQLALRWVQRNIKAFGGDPRRVTIFGQSAGGLSTHMHMLSPKSKGLFQHVISMSGTANVPFAIVDNALEQARLTAELCQVKDAQQLSTAKLARALRAVDVNTLLNAGDGLKFWDVDHMTNYRPVVEPSHPDAFLSRHPKDLLAEGSYEAVPWLLGTVPQEGAVRVVNIMENVTLREDFNSRFDELLQELMEFPPDFSQEQLEKSMQLILEEYFENKHEVNESTVQGFLDLISDRGFKQPLYNAHMRSVDVSERPLYMYSFNYLGPYSYASIYTSANVTKKYGVVHCDDLIYLFRSPMLFPDFERNSTEAKVVASFVDYFVHFAKTGKPRNAETLAPCSQTVLKSRPNGICDYQSFENSDEGFEVNVSQEFRTRNAKLWSHILGETKDPKNA